MDPAKSDDWRRFRDQVLYDASWPRRLWFAAVEDGLRRALGDDAPLLADFRRDVAELLRLEAAGAPAERDVRRLAQLEEQIRSLVEQADAAMTSPGAAVVTPRRPAAAARAGERRAWLAPLGRAAVLAATFALGMVAAGLAYEMRLASHADEEKAALARLVDERMAALGAGAGSPADGAALSGLDEARVGALRERVATMNQALDELGVELAAVEGRLPALDGQVETIADGARQVAGELAGASAKAGPQDGGSPGLTAWLARQKDDLERDLQGRRDALAAITSQVKALEQQVAQSQALLMSFNQSLGAGLKQARADGELLQSAVQAMRESGQQAASLLDGVKAKAAAAQDEMQSQIDGILSKLAEQADLAVLRGQDVIGRAESEVARRIDAESQNTLAELAKTRDAQLAGLADKVATTQSELEQTRAGLLESWRRMDQTVAERQEQVLAGLETYAGTIEARVEELLQALDVMVARTGG